MRYYIYLDKDFLKGLFSSIPESKFDIGIVDFTTQKSYSVTNGVGTAPSIDNRNSIEEYKDCDDDKDDKDNKKSVKKNKGNVKATHVGVNVDRSDTYQFSTTRRYINIEDISQIKNNYFYHELVVKLEEILKDKKEDHMCCETGNIFPCKLNNRFRDEKIDDSKSKFFRINHTYVWLDSDKLKTDVTFLCNILDKVKVVGYQVCNEIMPGYKVIKAIAVYIE